MMRARACLNSGMAIFKKRLAGFRFNSIRRINFIRRMNSIRAKFILALMVLSLVPLILLAFFSYRIYLDILKNNVQTYTQEVIDRVDRNLQIYLNDLNQMLELRNDYYNLQFIKLSMAGNIEENRKYTFRVWENLNNIKKIKSDLRDVSIITTSGIKISCLGITHLNLDDHILYQTLAKYPVYHDQAAFWGPHPDWLGGQVFSVGQAIRGDYDNLLGIMNIDIEMELIDRICRNIKLGKAGYIMLIDQNDQIVYHPISELIGQSVSIILGNTPVSGWKPGFYSIPYNQNITIKEIHPTHWKIVGISNQNELIHEMQKISQISLVLILCTIIVIIIVAFVLAGLLTQPIKKLQDSMQLAANDLNTNVVIRTNDEIGQLGRSFNQMLERIRQLMDQSVQEQKKLRRTEMIALQEQIKPHFIYNTLELIIGLLETNKNEDVIKMVEALGVFFRTSLSHGQEFISIKEEIEHIRNYLYIQRFRHGDKYNYEFDIDERLFSHKTIKLILQPLVENAIYHGIRELEQIEGRIIIKGYLQNDLVYFDIIDNGLGMPTEKVDEINLCLRGFKTEETEKRYFGIRNVNERIQLVFGKEYGLAIKSTPGAGTKVTVWIPAI